jgi:CheY-like chemotaxis protein
MQLALEDIGCSVRSAASGEEALALASRSAPQMVIADYRLPGDWNGLDTIVALRTQVGKDIPASIITGDLSADIQARTKSAGVHFLHKPIQPKQLCNLVHDLYARCMRLPVP